MLKEITLGQYYPGNSILHRLDPRVKLVGTLVFIISLFAFGSTSAYIAAGITLAVVITLSTVPVKYILRGLKTIFFLMLITALCNLFLTPGDVIFKVWKLQITAQMRLRNPEATLAELAGMSNPPVSKSAINHRMRKLVELAKE